LNGTKGAKQLPKDIFLSFWREVVHEDAPARPVHRSGPGKNRISRQKISGQRGIPWHSFSGNQRFSGTKINKKETNHLKVKNSVNMLTSTSGLKIIISQESHLYSTKYISRKKFFCFRTIPAKVS